MPSNYVGDEANTQAPSAKPEPEANITLALPVDGESRNVSSVYQSFKAVADFIDWLMHPQAKAALTPRFLRRYLTRVGHTRWALDRLGFPAATIVHWQEFWPGSIQHGGVTTITAAAGSAGTWMLVITGSGGNIGTSLDSIGTRLSIDGGDANGDESVIRFHGIPDLGANTDLAVEASVSLEDGTSAAVEHVFGLVIDSGGANPDDPNATDGIRFLKTPGNANWHLSSKNGGVETNNDSGVAAASGTVVRLRIEFRGANVNDGAAAAAYFFIDGAHAGTITTNLPPAAASSRMVLFGVRNTTGSSGAAERLRVFAVNYACNWFPAVT